MLALILLHAVTGTALIAAGSRVDRRAGAAVGAIAPAATLVWLATRWGSVLDGDAVDHRHGWIDALGLTIDLRLDAFAALMVLLVTGIGVLVFWYAASYFGEHPTGDDHSHASGHGHPPTQNLGRLFGLLTLFCGAMVGVVLADNLFLLYTFWEATSITSYLLIGNQHESARARASALQALLVTSMGGLAMFVGFALVGQAAGTFRLSAILADPPGGRAVGAGLVLILVGAATKSAQYPFHAWLPGAMVAPTPVSAYLHSATMVKAGVFLVARFAPGFADQPVWRPVVLTVGLVTMVFGALRALRQHDLKLLLAFGTVSQLGLLFVLFGAGTEAATLAGTLMLVAHALFKAALFMVVGILDHQTGTRDLRALPGLGRRWIAVIAVGAVSAASMAGVPLAFGFVAKEHAFAAFDPGDGGWAWTGWVLAVLVAGSCLTFAYSVRWAWGAFTPGGTDWHPAPPPADVSHPPAATFWLPPAILATATLLAGIAPVVIEDLVDVSLASLVTGAHHVHLALWHGVTLELGLSLTVYAVGVALFIARRPVAAVLARGHAVPNGQDGYFAVLKALNTFADNTTRYVQTGSLPFYAGVILFTATVAPGVVLLTSGSNPDWPEFLDAPAHVPVIIALVGAALGAAIVPRRLAAVLFLSVVGYAMAALFVVEGAPDLALTQVSVETLSTVLFVLVLRRLPRRFSQAISVGRIPRLVVSLLVGAMVFAFALIAADSRSAPPVSDEMVARAYPDGHGKNIVNVILVDFRGFDTLGEITVLAVAAVGAVALARAVHRPRPRTGERGGAS